MPKPPRPTITIPLETEVVEQHYDLFIGAGYEKKAVVVRLDVRRRDWVEHLGLPAGTRVRWENMRTVEVQELSNVHVPIVYRIRVGEGVWVDESGERRYFGVGEHLDGLDLKRGVTCVALRAAVLLAVVGCVGLRTVSWLMWELFHVETSKSALARWIEEAAAELPDAEGMVRRLTATRPVEEAHLDEIFPRGWGRGCVMVVKDEHGRLLAAEEVESRTNAQVEVFLRKLQSWGLEFKRFYIDGCEAYRHAIRAVYPEAIVQYDYFHVLQNIWRHLWRGMVKHRKDLKRAAKEAKEPAEGKRLLELAKRLWAKRGLMFKSDHRMSPEERQELRDLMAVDPEVSVLRGFLEKVWGIFRDSQGELGARQRLGKLLKRAEVKPGSPYEKATSFLAERFDDMIAFLRCHGVQRNSLAESGIRCLRRLEQGHDGFRGSKGRDAYLRLYQAIRYCGWTVHKCDGLRWIPPAEAPPIAEAA